MIVFRKKYLGIFLVVFLLGLIGFVFYYFSPGRLTLIRSSLSSSSATFTTSSTAFGIFFDSFSGLGLIDQKRTTLYLNKGAAAILFAPDYSWQAATGEESVSFQNDAAVQSYFAALYSNDFNGPYKDQRCLGKNCLAQEGLELYYNKRLVARPTKLKGANIQATSIAALGKKWLVGFTIKDNGEYRGEVFSFDGRKFTPLVFPQPIVSPYFGLFGFGGEDNDFLVIYGAYQGIAYRFQGQKVIDISKFFDIRVMVDGFKAEVIKTIKGTDTNWYVFSSTANRPQFLKLWQNSIPDIAGETIFNLFDAADQNTAAQTATFKLQEIKPTEITWLAQVKSGQKNSWYTFIDRGFKNEAGGILTFLPISYSQGNPFISLKEIKISRLDLDAASRDKIKLLFSVDNQNWREVPLGENLDFETGAASAAAGGGAGTKPEWFRNFFLQVVFPPWPDKFYSPFLGEILFEYYCAKQT